MASMVDNIHLEQETDLSLIFNRSQTPNGDDLVEFELYFDDVVTVDDNAIDYLSCKRIEIYSILHDILLKYCWTCYPFVLDVSIPQAVCCASNVPCLRGTKRISDHTEEEWFMVYLLWYLTHSMRNLSIAVRDSDGEFLLIEAAFGTPSWMTPEVAKNRVFIRQKQFHVLCHARNERLSLRTALEYLRKTTDFHTTVRPLVQTSLLNRIRGYAQVVDAWLGEKPFPVPLDSTHRLSSLCLPHSCVIILPLAVAVVIKTYPHLLGIAIDFLPPQEHLRSPLLPTPPKLHKPYFSFDEEDDVPQPLLITLTRYQFARLQYLKFKKPMAFSLGNWKKPDQLDKRDCIEALDMGSKICIGLYTACLTNVRSEELMSAFFWDTKTDTQPTYRLTMQETIPSTSDTTIQEHSTLPVVESLMPLTQCARDVECVKTRCTRFYHLLESCHHATSGSMGEASDDWLKKQKPLALNDDMTATSSQAICRFSSVLLHTYQNILSNVVLYSSVRESFHELKQHQHDTSWIELDETDVNALLHNRMKEDRFFALLNPSSSNRDVSHRPSSSEQKVKDVLKQPSDYRGINQLYGVPDPNTIPPLECIPSEFNELYERFIEQKRFSDSYSDETKTDTTSTDEEEVTSSDADNDDPFHKSSKKLSTFMESMDHELELMLDRGKDPTEAIPLRSTQMSDKQIESLLALNFKKSYREEPFLDPGPASLLFNGFSPMERLFQ